MRNVLGLSLHHPVPSSFRKGRPKLVEIAKELNISKSYLSMILSGQRNPNAQLRDKLCSLGLVNSEANLSLRGRCPRPLDECAVYYYGLCKLKGQVCFAVVL